MASSDIDQEKLTRLHECAIPCQVSFASGLFQGDVTIRTILESLVEGVVVTDALGTILLVNSSIERMFGYPREDLAGKPYATLFPERFATARDFIDLESQYPALAGLRRDGSEFPLEISRGFIETQIGVLNLFLVSDITRRMRAERRLWESEELFDLQIEKIKDYAIFTLDAGGIVLNWNLGAERLIGYRAEEIIGEHFSRIYPEAERAAELARQTLREAETAGQATREGWRIRKDGSRFWADVIITALHDEDGNLRGFSKVVRDITKRKQIEENLRRSEEKFLGIFEKAPFGIFQTAPDDRLTRVNPTFARMFGYQSPELMVESVTDVASQLYVHSEQRYGILKKALAADQYAQGEVEFRRRDGSHFAANLYIRSVQTDAEGYVEGFVEDISFRKEAEEALRKSELQFRQMAENIDEVFWLTLIAPPSVQYVNPAYQRIWGRSCDELYLNPKAWMEAIILEDLPRVRRDLEELDGGKAVEMEYRITRPDGALRWISDRGYPLRDGSGKATLVTGVATDITERKRLEGSLRTSESKLRVLFDNEIYAICIFDMDTGEIIDVNEAHVSMYGYTREELLSGMKAYDLSAEPEKNSGAVRTVVQTNSKFVPLSYHRKKDGTVFPVEIVGGAYLWNGRRAMFGLVHDITERVKAEKTLKQYARRLIEVEEDLRKRISMDLHDDIGQELTALSLNLAHVAHTLPKETGADIRTVLEDSRLLTKGISRSVRDLMADLRPSQLEEYGLAAAIRFYADQYAQRTGLAVTAQVPPHFPRLSAKKEIALFRITQEALNNILKHAAARKVVISLASFGAQVRLSIVDDGQGFLPKEAALQPAGSGWGLTIMRERAELVGGSFRLQTEVAAGTSVIVEVSERP